MEFDGIITIENLIFLLGLIIFGCWVRKTSLGKKALADSAPRRNNMPVYLPFIPLFIWIGTLSLTTLITKILFSDLQYRQNDFSDNLILCITELIAIAVIIFLARIHFARRLKGFGLNIKTILKDFFTAFVNLLGVWPVLISVMGLTIYFGELIWGREYQMQQHQQLKLIAEDPQLLSRILIVVVAVVIAPLLEEMLFRGLFQTMIRSHLEVFISTLIPQGRSDKERTTNRQWAWPAIVISSVLFTITHANPGHWPTLFVLGICMGYAYEKSGSLFRPIFIHSLFNTVSIIAVLNQ